MKQTPIIRALILATTTAIALLSLGGNAYAQGKYLNISLDGSFQRSYTLYNTNVRQSLGVDIGLPISEYFELSINHTLVREQEIYNSLYEDLLAAKGYQLPPGGIIRENNSDDTSVNVAFGIPIGHVKPSIFAGRLWRKICQKDTFEDIGCVSAPTFNAGASLAIYVTMNLRFRITYRISPSQSIDPSKKFDDLTSVGLTWGI